MKENNQNTTDCVQTGYLSLNKNGSIFTHIANGLKNLKVPVVGIWIIGLSVSKHFSNSGQDTQNMKEFKTNNIKHPTVWAATVRLLLNKDS